MLPSRHISQTLNTIRLYSAKTISLTIVFGSTLQSLAPPEARAEWTYQLGRYSIQGGKTCHFRCDLRPGRSTEETVNLRTSRLRVERYQGYDGWFGYSQCLRSCLGTRQRENVRQKGRQPECSNQRLKFLFQAMYEAFRNSRYYSMLIPILFLYIT